MAEVLARRCPVTIVTEPDFLRTTRASYGAVAADLCAENEAMNGYGQPVLYALVTGAPAARDVGALVDLAHVDGWDVCVIASPNGYRFVDADALSARTGHAVRHQYKDPDAPDALPPADAMVVAPITCNSLAKWAAGISDTLPLGLIVEAVGKRQPVVAMPFSNRAQLSFPAIQDAIGRLTSWGVTILVGDDVYQPHEPGTGDRYVHRFPWHLAWQALLHHPWLDLSHLGEPRPRNGG